MQTFLERGNSKRVHQIKVKFDRMEKIARLDLRTNTKYASVEASLDDKEFVLNLKLFSCFREAASLQDLSFGSGHQCKGALRGRVRRWWEVVWSEWEVVWSEWEVVWSEWEVVCSE